MPKKTDTASMSSSQDAMFSQVKARQLFEQAKGYAYAYMDGVYEREVFPTDDSIRALAVFDEPLPEGPCDSSEVLRLLHEYGSPATVAQTGGRYFGFVNGSILPAALAAKWLSDAWDQNAALHVMSPVASQLEAVCEKWLADLFGLPADTVAGFVSGSSTATMCGLAAGRSQILSRLDWDVNVKGLFGAPRVRVVLGRQAHASVFKALSLLGFGSEQLEQVPVDDEGCMNPSQMPELDARTLVIAQAGNVNSGAFDPLDELCRLAEGAGAWVHVDGAFGLWSAASDRKKSLTHGMARADSWSVDAHKTLNAPYDCGIVLCRHREALANAMHATGAYFQYSDKRDGMRYTPEMSRRARAVELWATLKSLGKSGVQELVDRLCDHARRLAERLIAEGFRVLNRVVFNQVLVASDTPEQTQGILEYIQKSGECWCGGSIWNGDPVIRVSVCSWATTTSDIDRLVAAFVKARANRLKAHAKLTALDEQTRL